MKTIALVGNPNSGKTTLFNKLTGLRQHTGNFPGVTVERMEGPMMGFPDATLVDLPGMYSLNAASFEEAVSRDFLTGSPPDAVINIVDATCLERGLYLTVQLLELGLPVVVAMNMMDEVRKGGGTVDTQALEKGLGVPVLAVSASRGEGVKAVAERALKAGKPAPLTLPGRGETDEEKIIRRYAFLEKLTSRAIPKGQESEAQKRSQRVDRVLTHPALAFPIFLSVMGLIFYLTFGPIGGTLNDGFAWLIKAFTALAGQALLAVHAADWLTGLITEGILTGVGTVLSFLPTILTLFFLLSLLEDSGYMARMAFVTDRLLRRVGLSGRSFVPALLGFGCSVPAVMATRTLSTRRDRNMTVLLVPFLSCSAKVPIYAMFAQAFFPGRAALVMLLLYAGGVLAAVPVALLLKNIVFPGEAAPFVLELPAYRLPTFRSAMMLVRKRTEAFLRCALSTLLIASIAVWALQRVDLALNPVATAGESALASLGRLIAPVFAPLGFGDWRAATALLSGLMAKEAVLSSMSVMLRAPTEYALASALRAVFTPLSAVSFLAFTLLYMPCVAAFAAAKRELGGFGRAAMAAAFQTGVAWLFACLVYNIGRLAGFS